MSENNQTRTSSPPVGQRSGRFWRGLLRLLLFALIVAIITAGIYYAIPTLYNNLVRPVQGNQAMITRLQQDQNRLEEEVMAQLSDQRERVAQLESELAAERERRSELEVQLNQQADTLAGQTDLDARLTEQGQTLASLREQVDALGDRIAAVETTLVAVEQTAAAPQPAIIELEQQVHLLQLGQALLKAQNHLTENNPGLAQLALQRGAEALARLQTVAGPAQTEPLAELDSQLEAVTTAIEEQPFVALQELEVLWQLLQTFSNNETTE